MKHTPAWIALGLLLASGGCAESSAPGGSSDPAPAGSVERLAQILEDPDPFSRAKGLAEVVPTLGEDALPYVKQTLDRFHSRTGVVEFVLLLRHWAEFRPEEATRWALEASPPLYDLNAIRTAFAALARVDPEKAVPYVLDAYVKSTRHGTVAQFGLMEGWFQKDREEALEYARALGPGPPRQRALHAYAMILADLDGSEAAIHWVESLPEDDGKFRIEAFQQTMNALVWTDLPAATRFCEEHCEGAARGLRTQLVRRRLEQGDPGGEVIGWVVRTANAETEDQQESADWNLVMAYRYWSNRDKAGAMAWFEEQVAQPEPEPWLKLLHDHHSRLVAREDPARGIEWAEKIEDEKQRAGTLISIVRHWRTLDADAAEAWLDQSPLDETQRQRVLKRRR